MNILQILFVAVFFHSSQDQWSKSASRAKWKDVSNTVEELGTMVKDQKGTRIKAAKKE